MLLSFEWLETLSAPPMQSPLLRKKKKRRVKWYLQTTALPREQRQDAHTKPTRCETDLWTSSSCRSCFTVKHTTKGTKTDGRVFSCCCNWIYFHSRLSRQQCRATKAALTQIITLKPRIPRRAAEEPVWLAGFNTSMEPTGYERHAQGKYSTWNFTSTRFLPETSTQWEHDACPFPSH